MSVSLDYTSGEVHTKQEFYFIEWHAIFFVAKQNTKQQIFQTVCLHKFHQYRRIYVLVSFPFGSIYSPFEAHNSHFSQLLWNAQIMAITIAVTRQQFCRITNKPKVYKLQFVEFKDGILFFAAGFCCHQCAHKRNHCFVFIFFSHLSEFT